MLHTVSLPPFDPLPPLPVLPLPAEQPYSYHPPQRAGRPGVISVIAITSIVIASLSILASAFFSFMDFGLLMASSAARAAPTVAPPTAGTVTTGGTPERLPFGGLPYADRQMFETGLQRLRPLSSEQVQQLDELLAERGKSVTGDSAVPPPDQLIAGITSSGHHAFGSANGSDYFVLATGKLELSDDRAVFFPSGLPSIHSNAIVIPAPTYPYTQKSLQPDQIRSVLRTISDLNGTKIKSAQARTIISALQGPGEDLIVATTDGTDPAYEVTSATTSPDGTLTFVSTHGNSSSTFNCDANGSVTSQSTFSTSGTVRYTGPVINRTAGFTAISLSAGQVFPGIFLLVAGILTLRYSPRGRLLHWIYVYVKLPLSILSAGVSFWMWTSAMHSAMVTGPGAPTTQAAAAGSAMAGVMVGILPDFLGCIWPIVLIFLLMSKSVRLYYAAGTSAERLSR
jgi:hypothetical protein